MIGLRRLDNIQECVEAVIRDKVPGDLIEAGVWRGGAAIFMRALLLAYGVRDKQVVAADSFDGVPPPRADLYPLDEDFDLHLDRSLAVPAEDVRANFDRFGLLDDRGEVVEGLFRNSLPALRARRWSVIRLDGDLYESTMDGLVCLYPNLSPGGFLIVDDYGAYPACAAAVNEYRARETITEPLSSVDWTGVYWRKASS